MGQALNISSQEGDEQKKHQSYQQYLKYIQANQSLFQASQLQKNESDIKKIILEQIELIYQNYPEMDIFDKIHTKVQKIDFKQYGVLRDNPVMFNLPFQKKIISNDQNKKQTGIQVDLSYIHRQSQDTLIAADAFKDQESLDFGADLGIQQKTESQDLGELLPRKNTEQKKDDDNFQEYLNEIERQKMNKLVQILNDELNRKTHVIQDIVQQFSDYLQKKYQKFNQNNFDKLVHEVQSFKELIQNLIYELYDKYIEANLSFNQKVLKTQTVQTISNQIVFKKDNNIYLTVIRYFKEYHYEIQKQINDKQELKLDVKPSQFQINSKFCLNNESDQYFQAIENLENMIYKTSPDQKLNLLYDTHQMVLNEIELFYCIQNQQDNLVAEKDIFSIYKFLVYKSRHTDMYVNINFIEKFKIDLIKDVESDLFNEKYKLFNVLQQAIQSIIDDDINDLITD